MSFEPSEAQFRFPLALQILFAIMTFLGVLVLPESPRWVSRRPEAVIASTALSYRPDR